MKRDICLLWLAAALLVSGLAMAPYDVQVATEVASMSASFPPLNHLAHFVSDWGNYVFYVGFAVALTIGLIKRDRWLLGLGLAYGLTILVFSGLIGRGIKVCVGRPRPEMGVAAMWHPWSFRANYNSFPSGHTMDAFAAVVPVWQRVRAAVTRAAVCIMASAIGLSRVMTHQHYPTDVLAGASLSLLGGMVIARLLAGRGAKWLPGDKMEGKQPSTSGGSRLG